MAGDLEAILGGNSRMALRPGHLIGDVSAYSGLASPADVVARGPGILAKWDLQHVREFTASSRRSFLRGTDGEIRTDGEFVIRRGVRTPIGIISR